MRKTITAITAAFFLLIPALCSSAYRIHLKDGREFTTERYWEEGDQIKFEQDGGDVGIPKDLVTEIKKVEDAPELQEGSERGTPAKAARPLLKHGATDEDVPKESSEDGASEAEKRQKETEAISDKVGGQEEVDVIEDEALETDFDRYQEKRKDLLERKRALEEAYDRAREAGDMPERIAIERALEKIDEKLSKLTDEQGK